MTARPLPAHLRPCGTTPLRAHTRARRDTRTVNRRRRYLAVLDRIVRKAA